jgi:hypothetical protein
MPSDAPQENSNQAGEQVPQNRNSMDGGSVGGNQTQETPSSIDVDEVLPNATLS